MTTRPRTLKPWQHPQPHLSPQQYARFVRVNERAEADRTRPDYPQMQSFNAHIVRAAADAFMDGIASEASEKASAA